MLSLLFSRHAFSWRTLQVQRDSGRWSSDGQRPFSLFLRTSKNATFRAPNGSVRNPKFGVLTSTESAERRFQFGVRFVFQNKPVTSIVAIPNELIAEALCTELVFFSRRQERTASMSRAGSVWGSSCFDWSEWECFPRWVRTLTSAC